MQIPNNHLRDRTCAKCNDTISKGERFIQNYLDDKNIDYIFNNIIEGCKLKKSLRFDFYLPKLNIAIEYDGEQHFRAIDYFGGEKQFLLTQQRDNIKNKWCIQNNIQLLRISYLDIIEDKLNQLFNI